MLASRCIAILALLSLFSPPAAAQPDTAPIIAHAPRAVPPFQYIDEKGEQLTLDTERNRLTIVHFWATWCVPCLTELPELDGISGTYTAKGVQIVAISLDATPPKVRQFYTEKQIKNLAANLDVRNTGFSAVGARGLPTTVFINRNGEAIARASGPLDWKSSEVTGFIDALLSEKP